MRFFKNNVKDKLHDNKLVFGSWIHLPCLEATEILARSGFDFLVIDREHSPISLQTAQKMVMVIEGYNIASFIRVEDNNPVAIKKALETGCQGLIIPMVNSKKQAIEALQSAYYYPKGIRSAGISRAQGYGLEFDKYSRWSDKNLSMVVQIEHIKAIENLEEILSVEDIDATLIGPYDLSTSMGCPGDFNNKDVKEALERYEFVSNKYSKPYGYHIVNPDQECLEEKIDKGYKFIAYAMDDSFLNSEAIRAVRSMKKLTEKAVYDEII